MKKLVLFCILVVFSLPVIAAKKKKDPVVGRKVKTSRREVRKEGLEMRKVRRVAIGATAGGALGFFGGNIELNLNEKTGIVGGYGGGPGYQSYTFALKQYIAGDSLLPYLGAGFTRWFNNNPNRGPIGDSSPGFLTEKFLSEEEKTTGVFGKNFVYTNIGAQYVNLDGEWAGFSLFVEVMLMVELSGLQAAPNAGIGMLYYF